MSSETPRRSMRTKTPVKIVTVAEGVVKKLRKQKQVRSTEEEALSQDLFVKPKKSGRKNAPTPMDKSVDLGNKSMNRADKIRKKLQHQQSFLEESITEDSINGMNVPASPGLSPLRLRSSRKYWKKTTKKANAHLAQADNAEIVAEPNVIKTKADSDISSDNVKEVCQELNGPAAEVIANKKSSGAKEDKIIAVSNELIDDTKAAEPEKPLENDNNEDEKDAKNGADLDLPKNAAKNEMEECPALDTTVTTEEMIADENLSVAKEDKIIAVSNELVDDKEVAEPEKPLENDNNEDEKDAKNGADLDLPKNANKNEMEECSVLETTVTLRDMATDKIEPLVESAHTDDLITQSNANESSLAIEEPETDEPSLAIDELERNDSVLPETCVDETFDASLAPTVEPCVDATTTTAPSNPDVTSIADRVAKSLNETNEEHMSTSLVDLTNDDTFEIVKITQTELSPIAEVDTTILISIDDSPNTTMSTSHAINETFSPEPSDSVFNTLNVEKVDILKTPEPIKTLEKLPMRSTKGTPMVKRLAGPKTPLSNRANANKSCNMESLSKMFSVTPGRAKNLLTSSLMSCSKVAHGNQLKSIRKRSLSMNSDCKPLKSNRVTFHSPSNITIPIPDIDARMETHAVDQENIAPAPRKRSMSNVETENDRKRKLHELSLKEKFTGSKLPRPRKLPDFSAIHSKRFERMENIKEHIERKENRAKELSNSGKKKALVKSIERSFEQKKDAVVRREFTSAAQKMRARQEKNVASHKKKTPAPAGAVGCSETVSTVDKVKNKQKQIIKGVRSNLRFDLMMKFREMSNSSNP